MIGEFTTLTDREWVRAYMETFDENGDETPDTYSFLLMNRFEDDGFDEELEVFVTICQERNVATH